MGRRHRKFKQAAFLLHIRPTALYSTGRACVARAPFMQHARDHTRMGRSKARAGMLAETSKYCELKGKIIIGIVDKAQPDRRQDLGCLRNMTITSLCGKHIIVPCRGTCVFV